MISTARRRHGTVGYPYTGRVITITNYLATTASHFTQINKGYPLDKDGGRAGVTHYAHAVGSALRTPRAHRPTRRKHETQNYTVAARVLIDQSRHCVLTHTTAPSTVYTPVPRIRIRRSRARVRAHVETARILFIRSLCTIKLVFVELARMHMSRRARGTHTYVRAIGPLLGNPGTRRFRTRMCVSCAR